MRENSKCLYCTVIRRRWQHAVQKILLVTGDTWNDVREEDAEKHRYMLSYNTKISFLREKKIQSIGGMYTFILILIIHETEQINIWKIELFLSRSPEMWLDQSQVLLTASPTVEVGGERAWGSVPCGLFWTVAHWWAGTRWLS